MRPIAGGLCLLLLWAVHAPAQILREELVTVSVMLMTRDPSYIPSRGDVVLTYVDEPLSVQVSLYNVTGDVVELTPRIKSWETALEVSLTRDEPTSEPRRAIRIDRQFPPGRVLGRSPLMPGEAHRIRLALRTSEGLAVGRYRLQVAIPDDVLAGRARTLQNLLKRELVIDVIDPQTPLEQVDYYLNRSFQEFTAGRIEQARVWAERALKVHPNGISALTDLGEYALREKDCVRAQPHFERAILLLRTGGDQELRLSLAQQEELASALRSRLSRHCG
jgi:hypothetical protein